MKGAGNILDRRHGSLTKRGREKAGMPRSRKSQEARKRNEQADQPRSRKGKKPEAKKPESPETGNLAGSQEFEKLK